MIRALTATIFFLHMYIQFPATKELTVWYARGFVIDVILVLALGVYAF
ncbi:MAG TPA: hypothetical protein VEW46_24525 [Pyrinomonadaceae bacterium]|nr:hypothetical protein [Pyrinomonadaceae bacterium]